MPPASEFPAPNDPPKVIVDTPGTGQGVVLAFEPVADASDPQTMVMTMKVSGSGGGQSISMGMDISADTTVSLARLGADGTFDMKTTIGTAKVKLSGDMVEAAGPEAGDMAAKMMEGQTTSVTLDKQGRTLKADMGENSLDALGGGGMNSALEGGAVTFPTTPVAVGAKWRSLGHIEVMGAKIRFVTEFELQKLDGKKGQAAMRMVASLDQASPMKTPQGDGTITALTMNVKGTMQFDLARPTASAIDLDMDMDADIEAMGDSGSLDLTGHIATTVKR